jgi:diguanylate cyclase (GGDEF)-like protein
MLQAVAELIQSNERIQRQLEQAESKLKSQAQEIANQASAAQTDPLTQLANRRGLDAALDRAVQRLEAGGAVASIMLVDIDHFKLLNDTYGHQAGDAVLCTVARTLRQHMPADSLVARHGGEEFAVVFSGRTLREVAELAERTRKTVGQRSTAFEETRLNVTLSAGLAQLANGEQAGSLVRRADEALYVSKETGRDRSHVHDGCQTVPVDQWLVSVQDAQPAHSPARQALGVAQEGVFRADLRRRLSDWRAGGAPLCMLLLQVDDLETVRQREGEKNAAAILRATALTLKATMREMDQVGQFQGDCLSMLLPGSDLAGAIRAGDRLRRAVARCELPEQYRRRTFTASVVVAEAMADEQEQQLVSRVQRSLVGVLARGSNGTYVDDGTRCHLVGAGNLSPALPEEHRLAPGQQTSEARNPKHEIRNAPDTPLPEAINQGIHETPTL